MIFVIDAVKPCVKDAAEFLYDILTDPTIDELVGTQPCPALPC